MVVSTIPGADTQSTTTGVTNVLLVHGAFSDGSSCTKVIPLLEAKALTVIAVQSPLTALADHVAVAKRSIALQNGSVFLVGYSWGGVVITEAGNEPKVAGILYVAVPPASGTGEIRPDATGFYSLTDKGIKDNFAQDLPEAKTRLLFAT